VSDAAFEVAFICTGNRFRSPLAAALLAAERPDLSLSIASFGTLELGAARALPEAVEIGRSFGVDLSVHRARSLSHTDLEQFELVLGFERHHIATAVVDCRARPDRTFTLPELVGLLEPDSQAHTASKPLERAREHIEAANAARPHGFRNRALPELADPLGRSRSVQWQIAATLRTQVSSLAAHLFD
jgi:protein-tyrosine phosphatase